MSESWALAWVRVAACVAAGAAFGSIIQGVEFSISGAAFIILACFPLAAVAGVVGEETYRLLYRLFLRFFTWMLRKR